MTEARIHVARRRVRAVCTLISTLHSNCVNAQFAGLQFPWWCRQYHIVRSSVDVSQRGKVLQCVGLATGACPLDGGREYTSNICGEKSAAKKVSFVFQVCLGRVSVLFTPYSPVWSPLLPCFESLPLCGSPYLSAQTLPFPVLCTELLQYLARGQSSPATATHIPCHNIVQMMLATSRKRAIQNILWDCGASTTRCTIRNPYSRPARKVQSEKKMESAAGTPQAECKLRDTFHHIEEPEKAALVGFTLVSLVTWILLLWWYTSGVKSREAEESA